jgi:PAS domain S-box-containing protein
MSMMSFIRQWFASPVFENDEEKTRRASFLNISTHSLMVLLFLTLASMLVGGSMPVSVVASNSLALVIMAFLRYWLHRGKVALVGSVLLAVGFSFTTFTLASLGTIRVPAATVYLFLIILTGVLFNARGIVISAALSSLCLGSIILAENAGLLPQPDYSVTVTQWTTYSVLFVIIGWMAFFARQSTQTALEKARREIAAREQAEAQLRKLTRAVEQSPTSIVITDLDGKIEYVNPRFTQVTGYTAEEALGQNPRILKTEVTPAETHVEMWQTLQAGREWRGEFVNRKKNDEIYYESAVISAIIDQQGLPTHYIAVKEDITERKQAEEKLRQQNEYLLLLHQITLDLLNRRNLDELLQLIVDRAMILLDSPFAELMLEQDGELELIVQTFTENQNFAKGSRVSRDKAKLTWQVFDTKSSVVVEDYAIYPHRNKTYPTNIHATAAFPILARDKCIGVLALGRSQPGDIFTESQIKNGVLFAQLAALTLDSAQLFAAAQREIAERARVEEMLFNQNQRLAVLHQITLELLRSRDVDALLNTIVTQAAQLVGAPYGSIFLSEGEDLVLRAAIGDFAPRIGIKEKKPGAGVLGEAWRNMKPFVVANYSQWEGHDPDYAHLGLGAFAGIPIIGHDGPLGVLEVARMEANTEKFTPQEVEVFVQFASLASLVLDNAQLYKQAQSEREKADSLLRNIFPQEIAGRLKQDTGKLVADRFEQASILFADVVNFTQLSSQLAPEELVQMLDEVFSCFDKLVEQHGLEKIKTIGDCYMAVAGVPNPRPDHARALIRLALDFRSRVASRKFYGQTVQLRIGINSGPVVAGVIGNKRFAYDLWGDTVNVASRMEAQGIPNQIQITESTYQIIHEDFICEPHGTVYVKGKGEMPVWHIVAEK